MRQAMPDGRLELSAFELHYRDPFRIARAAPDRLAVTFISTLRSEGRVDGTGEAYPEPYYGENVATIPAVSPGLLASAKAIPEPGDRSTAAALDWLEAASAALDAHIRGHGGAKAGIDIALHDRAARERGL